MSSIHGKLRAKKWSVWTEELYSAPGSPGDPSISSRGSSPLLLPPTEDVMKLSRDDMHTYGQCPSWDGLILVTCEKCARNVKIEWLESHITLRHGSKSERTAYSKVLAARSAAAPLRQCQVRLDPVIRSLSETPSTTSSSAADKSPLHSFGGSEVAAPEMGLLLSGSSGSTSPQPVSFPSSPPAYHHHNTGRVGGGGCSPLSSPAAGKLAAATTSLPLRPAVRVADSASAPDTRSPSPEMFMGSHHHEEEEAMEVDDEPQAATAVSQQGDDKAEPQDVEMTPVPALPSALISSSSASYQKTAGLGSVVGGGAAVGGVTASSAAATGSLRYLGDEADSTTAHNVISIPDTEDIPNIEIGIISEGQVLDSINTKYNVSLLKSESSPVDSTTTVATTKVTIASPTMKGLGNGQSLRFGGGGQSGSSMAIASGPRIQVVASNNTNDARAATTAGSVLQLPGQPRIISLPIRTNISQQQQQQADKMDTDSSHQQQHVVAPTHYITVSPLSKAGPKKPVVGMKGGSGLGEKKSGSSREREYDPNKHCGVWDGDARRNCTRSLTCKSHSVYLKRKVINRSGTFDELLAAHKADKELASSGGGGLRPGMIGVEGQGSLATESLAASAVADGQSSILARRLQLAPGTSTPIKVWDQQQQPTGQSSLLKPALIRRPFYQQQQPQQQQQQQLHHQTQLSVSTKEFYCDENLHFSTEHPKPLAVCTFGGKRVGSIFLADRSRILTRKVMKIAISSSGVPRLQSVLKADQLGILGRRVAVNSGGGPAAVMARPQQQSSSLPFLVSLQSGPTGGAPRTISIGGGGSRVGTLQIAATGIQATSASAAASHYVVQDAFKTDIQDFKGGIKFELSRNMLPILPQSDLG